MTYGQGDLISQSLSNVVTFCSNLQELTWFSRMHSPATACKDAIRTCYLKNSKTSKWGEQTPHKVSLPRTQRQRQKPVGVGVEGESNFLSVEKSQGKDIWPLIAQSPLLFTSQRPSLKVPLRHSFPSLVSTSLVKTTPWHSLHWQIFLSLSLSAASGNV